MAEIGSQQKPIMHSSVDAVKRAVDAKNASQKADLLYEGPQAQRKLVERLEALERTVTALRGRIEVLEAEDGVVLPWQAEDR